MTIDRGEKTYEHESYVLVQLSRRQGSTYLFGSALESHQSCMTLSVRRAKLIRSDSGDHYYGNIAGDIIEIDVSAAQFADMLTNMNVGMGVPGTMRRLMNARVEPPPRIDTEAENIRTEYKSRLKRFAESIEGASKKLDTILDKKSLTKDDRSNAKSILSRAVMEMSSNMPFFLEMYQEATEKIRTAAKSEIEAFMQVIVSHMGLKALSDAKELAQLPAPSEEKKPE
jgi:hypothetical protein